MENAHTHRRIADQIDTELLRRKFSAKQLAILRFILQLSWRFGKKVAVVPMLKDFELCGVDIRNVEEELGHLVTMRVIMWDLNTNQFAFNTNVSAWQVTRSRSWNNARFEELIRLAGGGEHVE